MELLAQIIANKIKHGEMDGSTVTNLETFLRKNHPGVYQIYNTWREEQLQKEENNFPTTAYIKFSATSGVYTPYQYWSVRAKKLTELIKEHGL
jgi:hypothetical protein